MERVSKMEKAMYCTQHKIIKPLENRAETSCDHIGKEPLKFIRFPAVQELVGGCSRSTIWRWMRTGSFPKSYQLGPNVSAWLECEVLDFIKMKARKNERSSQ